MFGDEQCEQPLGSAVMNRHISRSLYWDVHTSTGHASYGQSFLTLRKAPTILGGSQVSAIDYAPVVHLVMVLDSEADSAWRPLTPEERDDLDTRLERMVIAGLSVWD